MLQLGKTTAIYMFIQENRFLSNFYPSPILWWDRQWPTVENAYQASKEIYKKAYPFDSTIMEQYRLVKPGEAKRMGRRVQVDQKRWGLQKYHIMSELVDLKFCQNPDLLEKLLATGDADLVEGNTWGDMTWGAIWNEKEREWQGGNALGHILMNVRKRMK